MNDYEIIVNPNVNNDTDHMDRDDAVAKAAEILIKKLPGASIWQTNPYEAHDTEEEQKTGKKPVQAVGFNIETEDELPTDFLEDFPEAETIEELATDPIES